MFSLKNEGWALANKFQLCPDFSLFLMKIKWILLCMLINGQFIMTDYIKKPWDNPAIMTFFNFMFENMI